MIWRENWSGSFTTVTECITLLSEQVEALSSWTMGNKTGFAGSSIGLPSGIGSKVEVSSMVVLRRVPSLVEVDD